MIEERTLGEDAADELKQFFDAIDTDGSGEIGADELGELVRQLGLVRSEHKGPPLNNYTVPRYQVLGTRHSV